MYRTKKSAVNGRKTFAMNPFKNQKFNHANRHFWQMALNEIVINFMCAKRGIIDGSNNNKTRKIKINFTHKEGNNTIKERAQ